MKMNCILTISDSYGVVFIRPFLAAIGCGAPKPNLPAPTKIQFSFLGEKGQKGRTVGSPDEPPRRRRGGRDRPVHRQHHPRDALHPQKGQPRTGSTTAYSRFFGCAGQTVGSYRKVTSKTSNEWVQLGLCPWRRQQFYYIPTFSAHTKFVS